MGSDEDPEVEDSLEFFRAPKASFQMVEYPIAHMAVWPYHHPPQAVRSCGHVSCSAPAMSVLQVTCEQTVHTLHKTITYYIQRAQCPPHFHNNTTTLNAYITRTYRLLPRPAAPPPDLSTAATRKLANPPHWCQRHLRQ